MKNPSIKQQKFAKKSLGQNFLQSAEIRDKIINSAGEIENQNILEIGPGLGFLTEAILKNKPKKLIAIEFDERSVGILNTKFVQEKSLELIHNDFLAEDLDHLWGNEKWEIIANIPYNITNPILKKICAQTKNKPKTTILMIQKEVAEKIINQKKRSILSISVEIFAEVEYLFTVDRKHFIPSPKVDSAVIKLKMRESSLVPKELDKTFFSVVNRGFSSKRKKIKNNLPPELLEGIDENRRAENLNIEEWITIAKIKSKKL
jgi:16S rRNA (adenine1518-N6/adenine1519-N6)-dimethyltransferase